MDVEMSELDKVYERIGDDLEPAKFLGESDVQKFYAGKTLFITGATGFIGKSLVEKLLRSCSDLKHIYILLRDKKGITVEERLKTYLQHEIFGSLRKINPNYEKQVTAMKGELFMDRLGLSEHDRDILKREVDIILHNAANVKFTAKVSTILKENVLGTKNMLDLAEDCDNLDVFVYVSTAYSHCYKKRIHEEFYAAPGDLKMVQDMINSDMEAKNGLSEEAVKMLIGDHPNIYTFTKAISEDLIRQRAEKVNFACGVYRPSIVVPTIREPLVGWSDNMNGPILYFIGVGLGIVHVGWDFPSVTDLVPCDMATNALIVTTRDLWNRWKIEKKAVIYNYGSSTSNPVRFSQMYDYTDAIPVEQRFNSQVTKDFMIITQNLSVFLVLHVIFHIIPALLMDLGLLLIGRKPIAFSVSMKITWNFDKIFYFAYGDWKIFIPETLKVIDKLNPIDKELFHCDVRQIKWEDYVPILAMGMKKYLLKEDMNSETAGRHYKILTYIHHTVVYSLILAFEYVLYYYTNSMLLVSLTLAAMLIK